MKKLVYILVITTLCLNTAYAQEKKIDTNLEVGTLPGSVSINPDGSSSYTIPITTLPGRAGMEPAVALIYNSMSGNGSLGIGWSISGMQAITRGGTNLYFEDAIDGIDFDENDQYYLNGQRLIKIGDNEYRTEQDGFSKIITYGTAGSGPKTFTVREKNGIELQFGHTSNSRIEASGRSDVLFWRLNRIIDKRGNYIDYVYDESGHEGLIKSIKYTGNKITRESPFNSIDFYYTDRYDNNTFYIYGSNIQQTKLLDRIETKYNNQLQNTYKLVYDESGISPRLTSVQPITKSGAKMNATNFEWGREEETFGFDHSFFEETGFEEVYTMGDFDGNGKTDVLVRYFPNDGVVNNKKIYIFYSNGDGTSFNKHQDPYINEKFKATTILDEVITTGDFNGDGLTDLAAANYSGLSNYYRIIISVGIGFLNYNFAWPYSYGSKHEYINVDINGNGIEELLSVQYDVLDHAVYHQEVDENGDRTMKFDYNIYRTYIKLVEHEFNGYQADTINLTSGHGPYGYYFEHQETNLLPIQIGDFNGDGRTNILINKDNNQSFVLQYNEQNLIVENIHNNSLNYPRKTHKVCFTGDFNGDGISDLFTGFSGGGPFQVSLFNGHDGWNLIDCPVEEPAGNQHTTYQDFKYQTADYNGDGKTDILQFYHEYYDEDIHDTIEAEFVQNHWVVHYSKGLSFVTETFTNTSYKTFTERLYVNDDLNGDGKNDFIMPETGRIMFFHKNEKNNLIHTFTNGLGHQSSVEYDYLTNNEIYEKGGEAEYPIIDIQPPMAVATKSLTQNSEGGFFESEYSYKNALVHLKGKGMLGFGEFIELNKTANTITEIKFEVFDEDAIGNPFYFFPYPSETSLYSTTTNDRDRNLNINGRDLDMKDKLLSRTINTMDVISTTNNTFNYMPILTQTISHIWDNNSANSHISTVLSIQDKRNIDIYGNSTHSSTKVYATANIHSKPLMSTQTIVTYKYDISNWIVNRPLSIISTTTTTEGGSTRSEANYIYYNKSEVGGNGVKGWPLVKSVETIPEGDNDFKNTTTFEYDKYGNITKNILKALDLSGNEPYQTITKTIDYEYESSNGYLSRFLTKSTIKEGPDYEISYTYYHKKGQLATVTNPAGLQTGYSYDDFGRLQLSTFADGTTSESRLNWSSEENKDAPEGSLYYTWSKSSGSGVNQIFYNFLSQPIRVTGEGLSTRQKIFVDTKYDTRGLIRQVSEPFFAENPPDEHDERKWTFFRHDRIGRPIFLKTPTNSYATIYKGLKTSVLDFSTRITKINTKNSLGQTIKVSDPAGDIDYTYYPTGLLHTTNALGQITTLTYDAAGNKATMTEPNSGTYRYKFSAFGELLEQTDAKGNITKIQYDGLGRPKTKNLNNDITTYKYNSATGTDGFGLIKEVRGHNGIYYTYQYDQLNRLEKETKLIDGNSYTSSLEYDSYSRVKTYTYPSDYKIDYLYTPETGIFYKVEDHQTGNMLYETGEINQRGQLMNYFLGNGLETTKNYDFVSGFVERITTGEVQNLAYRWDNRTGNLLQRYDFSLEKGLAETFTYDDLLKSRLATWQVNTEMKYMAGYKNNGNITYKSDITWPVEESILYGTPQDKPNAIQKVMLPTTEYLNHASQKHQISYNGFNKLESILQTHEIPGGPIYNLDIFYGPDNLRRKTELRGLFGKIVETKYFISTNYEVEIDVEGNKRQLHYLSASDGTFAIYEWQDSNKKMYYIHKDHLGSYETITDEEGRVVEKLSFDPWGRRRNPDTWSYENIPTNNLFDRGFTNHEHLDIFGLINMNGRVYDAWVGSFLSPDPILQAPANSQNYNRYTYAMNNPLKYIDPSGYDYEMPITSGPRYDYNGSLNPGSSQAAGLGGGTGGMSNPYRAAIISTTAHEINRANGASYEKIAWRGKRGYVNTWTGQSVTWDDVKRNIVNPKAKHLSSLNELYDFLETNFTTKQNRQKVFINSNGKYYGRDRRTGTFYLLGTNIVIDPLAPAVVLLKPNGQAGGDGNDFEDNLNSAGQIGAISGTANAVKSQLFYQATRTSSIPLKNLSYVKGVGYVGIAGSLFGMGVSSYNMYSDYSQYGTVNSWDVADFGVGAASLGATIFLISNPVGWVIVGGASVYFISRAVYDATTND